MGLTSIGEWIPMIAEIDKGSLLEGLSDAVFVCKKDGDLLYCNRTLGTMLGFRGDEIMGKNLAKDVVQRDLEWKALVSLLEQGSPILDYELKLNKADGTPMCGSLSATNLRSPAGAFIGIAGVLRDITTRKAVEHELRDKAFRIDVMNKVARLAAADTDVRRRSLVAMCSELRKLLSFEALTVGLTEENGRHVDVVLADPDKSRDAIPLGSVTFAGSIVEKLKFGREPIVVDKWASNKGFSELAVIDASKFSSMLSVPMVSRGRLLGSVNVFHSRPNEYKWESADTLQMVADQIAGLIDNLALLLTLENKYMLQEALVRSGVEIQKAINSEEIYAAIASNIREVIPYTELSFYMIDWGARMVKPVYAVGEYAAEVMASPGTLDEGVVGVVAKTGRAEFMDDVDSDPRAADVAGVPAEHQAMLALPLAGPDGVMGVLELYRPKGQVFTASELETGKLFAQQASVALATSTLVSRLQDAKKEIEMLNDLMFHDINNFNFASLNYIEMVAKGRDLPAEHRAHLEKSLQLIRQTATLIESVKKLTKIGIMSEKDFVPIDVGEVLRKVTSGVETAFADKDVSIKLNVPDHCVVLANPLLDELFVNLLSNSVKYDPHDPVEIDIDCEKVTVDGHPFLKVCISDRGEGVPNDKKHLLFQKHVRLKPEANVGGSGLGLSVCRALVDKFGGKIWVEDRVPGKVELGSKFCVTLPTEKDKHVSQ